MTVGTQRLAISPRLGNGIDDLISIKTQQLGNDSCTSDLDENNMIKTDTIEGVEKGKASLDLMSLDHAREDIMDGELLALTGEVIRDGEDGSQVVGRVTPFRGEETVVEVEPSDHCSNVECAPDGVELIVSSWDSSALIRGKQNPHQRRRTISEH